jgi:hypothetical protein
MESMPGRLRTTGAIATLVTTAGVLQLGFGAVFLIVGGPSDSPAALACAAAWATAWALIGVAMVRTARIRVAGRWGPAVTALAPPRTTHGHRRAPRPPVDPVAAVRAPGRGTLSLRRDVQRRRGHRLTPEPGDRRLGRRPAAGSR